MVAFLFVAFGFFTNNVMAIGVREPEPKILPPSFLLNSPLVRWLPRRLKTQMLENSFSKDLRKPSVLFPSNQAPLLTKAMIPPFFGSKRSVLQRNALMYASYSDLLSPALD